MEITEQAIKQSYEALKSNLFQSKKGMYASELLEDEIFIQELNSLNAAKEVLEYALDEDDILEACKESKASLTDWLKQIARGDTAIIWQEDPGQNCYWLQDINEYLLGDLDMAESN